MKSIHLLDSDTINKIAAGEVVERPSSVIKELVENAIDAKASAITIEIKEGGIAMMRVTDNGGGIDRDDIKTAFVRHATSKIETAMDLMTVGSLGFRGEALSSIAFVSQIELITKVHRELLGVRYCIDGGEEKSCDDIGCPDGTTIIVRNLFYNTPARRKFLKTAATEAAYINDLAGRLALSHPDVSFKFINNNQNRLHTSGNGNLRDIIYQIYGRDVTGQLLEVDLEHIEKYLMDLSMERKVILKEADGVKRVYPSNYYYMEMNTAKMLHDLNVTYDVSETGVLHRLAQIEENMDLPLDEKQREAVVEAVRHGVLVLTGGPGTGKTTTINAMIHYFESDGADILLAAPTGRAAKRMTETTGYEAQTVHRLLEVSGNPEDEEQKNGFSRNRDNPLETDVIIVDEMSMVDLPLMHALLSAVCVGTRLILVGDRNQLPSVGPGSVLKDIIASKCFPVVKLTRIFRQAGESDIVVNAHKINRGEPVILDNKSRDFFFLKRQDANTIISVVLTLIQKKLPKYVNAEPYDIQVLTPMRKGLLGVVRLNGILQEYLNPPSPSKAEKEYGDKKFREGDKVMQIKNNYQIEWEVRGRYGIPVEKGLGIFNGDMGIVTEINTYTETLEVEYDEKRKVKYPFELLEELELSYAITIHKSQGSEYPAVVIPLLSGPRQLFHRNLLYTAITRARKCVTIVGNDQTFQEMIRNTNEHNRNTSLAERIREFCG